ncbi:FLYWCH zinc finger domain-containing protein [Phthorimaea operculella]|nr:FLYWCH zinc finger domain-containing protein [Phthorimaea operculella]
MSRFGNPVMMVGVYRYNLNNKSKGMKKSWYFKWIKNPAGKQLAIVNGYTFNSERIGGYAWRCTTRSRSCRARFIVDDHRTVKTSNTHDHPPSISDSGEEGEEDSDSDEKEDSDKEINIDSDSEEQDDSNIENKADSGSGNKEDSGSEKKEGSESEKKEVSESHHSVLYPAIDETASEVPLTTIQWVKSENGKTLAFVNGYTFSRNSRFSWYCTSRNARGGCKARLVVSPKEAKVLTNLQHSHRPTFAYEIRNGILMRKSYKCKVPLKTKKKGSKLILTLNSRS